ncbi:MAG: hypothetical protein IJT69_03610 [Clostridia bacterium]|nr:hypothetical protein [Clostridia bacterium]
MVICLAACGGSDRYDLTEETFFYGMTTMQLYPEEYVGKAISFDCFTYRLTDVAGVDHLCGVRKCSAGYGCNCGKDTIIGFILDYDGVIPEPRNQSEDTPDKSWIHVEGSVASAEREEIVIHAYDAAGQIDEGKTETVVFYHFAVTTLTVIEDYSGLAYYVTK